MNLRQTSGPVLERAGDLAALLTSLEPHDVLFIDEIHRLSPVVEEILYPALEDYQLDIMIGEGPAARSVKLDLPPFTLVGATTRAGMLTNPLARPLWHHRPAGVLQRRRADADCHPLGRAVAGADCRRRPTKSPAARGTPRIANRLLRRVRDFAEVRSDGRVSREIADAALSMLDVDHAGLDVMDRKLLSAIIEKIQRRPGRAGQCGSGDWRKRRHHRRRAGAVFDSARLAATHPRGRMATVLAYQHFGLSAPERLPG